LTVPIRVLFVNPGHAVGGAEQCLLLLVDGLQARGEEAVAVLFGNGPLRDRLSALGVETTVVVPPRRVRSAGRYGPAGPLARAATAAAGLPTAVRLAAAARRARADVIHTNGMKAHLLGGLAGRLATVPVLWHLHDFPPAGWTGRVFRKAARRLPALVLANSEAVARTVRSSAPGGIPVVTLRNPVDVGRFHPSLTGDRIRRELGIGRDVPLVGMVAHLTPWKGHALFLEIACVVAETLPRARFVVVGGSIYETDGHVGCAEALVRQATVLGLSDRVIFLGVRDDIPEILAGLDVLIHCPIAPEPFGLVLAEAMAVGRPVVASRSGGIPEVVEDQTTGLLVAPGAVGDFASAVIALLRDHLLRDRLGKAGRRRAETLFGVEAHVTGVLEAYQTVLGGRARSTTPS
jgi:glycosyltransferase involved in cell wall biosynthesis